MRDTDDVARFRPDEDDAMVMAALMCPYCLRRPAHVIVNHHHEGGNAICACARCDLQWSVGLDAEQTLRLLMAPPQGLWMAFHPLRDA
jgi:hypothetical protein